MFTEKQKKQIIAMYDKQTKYANKKEFLEALKEHLIKNVSNQNVKEFLTRR